MPTSSKERPDTRYTWSDYRNWSEEDRWEIIDGTAYAMSPAPSTRHQTVVLRLSSRLEQALAGKPCRAFIAPTDVRLSDTDVVQPDILVVCDAAKITPTHVEGAPDVVMEILSPATATKDLRQKRTLYERTGVREYVVVDPLEHYAMRFLLGPDGFDKGTVFGPEEKLIFATLEAVEVALWEVFEVAGPDEAAADAGHP